MAGNLCRCGCYEQITRRRDPAPPPEAAPTDDRDHRIGDSPQPRRRHRPRHRRASGTSPTSRLAGRPPREAGDARLRAGADPARSTPAAALAPARRPARDDRRRPAPAHAPVRAAVRRTGPSWRVGETKYHGEPVALVVADTRELAEAAAAARARGARGAAGGLHASPRRSRRTRRSSRTPPCAPATRSPARTCSREHRVGWGDVDAEAREPTSSSRARYTFPMVTHFAIEPHAFIAAPDGDGIAVWSTIQHPNWLQKIIAGLLGCRSRRCGCSRRTRAAASAASSTPSTSRRWSSRRCRLGRPVRLVLTLEETFQAVRRAACEVRVRTGFDRDGRIAFQDIEADYLIGAYADIADRVVGKGSYPAAGPYNVPAVRIVARERPVAHRAVHRVPRLRQPADQLGGGVEPRRGRAGRWASTGSRSGCATSPARATSSSPFDTPCDGDWEQAVRLAAERIGWGTPLPGGPRPRASRWGSSPAPRPASPTPSSGCSSTARVVVYAGTSDMGQGARTVFAQIAAQELGAPLDWVTVVMGDTAVVPYDQQTSASRSTVLMGNSVLAACRAHPGPAAGDGRPPPRRSTRPTSPWTRGVVGLPDRELTSLEVLGPGLGKLGGELTGLGEARKEAEPGHPLGGAPAFFEFNCTAIEAEVDRETGDVTIVPPRHRSRRGQGPQPAPGPDAGRGRGDHGPRPHADGALHLRRAGPDPEPGRHRLPDPDQHGPAARARTARRSRTPTGPGPYGAEGHERGRAAVRRRRRWRQPSARRPASRSATCR